MNNLNDPDGMVLEVCHLLLNGTGNRASMKPILSIRKNYHKGKYDALVEVSTFDAKKKKNRRRPFELGEGRTVALARDDLLTKLMARAQAVMELPIEQIMES
jgi:hypothetical protein